MRIFSFKFVAYQSLKSCHISCANKHEFEKIKTFVRCWSDACKVLNIPAFSRMLCLLRFLLLAKIKLPTLNGAAFSWDFSWEFLVSQYSEWRCVSWANKHGFEKIRTFIQCVVVKHVKSWNQRWRVIARPSQSDGNIVASLSTHSLPVLFGEILVSVLLATP